MENDKIAILIKKASLECDKFSNASLARYNLTTSQFKIMKYLYEEAENGVRTVDLENFFSLSHPTTIGILKNLQKKGLIRYETNPNHARSRFIVPTDEALKMRQEIEGAGDIIEDEMTRRLSEDEKSELKRLLKVMMGIREEQK